MKIEIDDDFVEEIVGEAMINSCKMVKDFLKDKKNHHPDDVKAWEELLPALIIVGKWYMVNFEKKLKAKKK